MNFSSTYTCLSIELFPGFGSCVTFVRHVATYRAYCPQFNMLCSDKLCCLAVAVYDACLLYPSTILSVLYMDEACAEGLVGILA